MSGASMPPVAGRAPASRVRMDRVCIVMMSAVGDVVHVLPLLTALKRHHPAMHVTWVLQAGPASVVRGHPDVDEILIFDRTKGWRGFADIRRELRSRRFDLVINLQVYFKAGIITGFTRAPVKLGFDRARARDANWLFTTDRVPARPMQHVQDQYLEFADWLGVPYEPVTWNLGPWGEKERAWQRDFFARFDRPVAPIVVATSKPQKDWMPERWAEVSDALWHDFGLQPVLVGGRSPREEHAERVILERTRVKPFSALGNGGLRGLVGIIDGSALVLSPDTGPLHMTVALDRPVVSLIGYSNPKRVGPYRKFRDLMIDAYGDPGEDYPLSMENRLDRMPRITVQQVLDKVERWRSVYASERPVSSSSGA
ncbi:MAG TPA: glycosyltransferase family 9 protein [Gemmatimonadaceae bacterium]|nr:glycosyltransferase family 9 protein [Gemmatimonadaceae bacterium]